MLKRILKPNPCLTWICERHYCGYYDASSRCQWTSLPNEVKVATVEMNSALACMTLAVTAGSRYETSWTNGLTHFIEHLAFKGFRTLSVCNLQNMLMDMNAKLSVHTSREQQVFSVVLPSENALAAVDILCRIVTELDINEYKIHGLRDEICQELADSDADPTQVLFDYLNATAFQGTPLAQSVIGPSENVCRFNAEFAGTFLSENYVPNRLCLATAGRVTHKEILETARTCFGCIESVPVSEPDRGPNRFTGSQVVYRDDTMPVCYAAIAFEAPGYASPEYYQMLVLKYIVGSWDRSQGRGLDQAPSVARWVALDKLCDRYKPFYIAYRDIGLWGVYFYADKWKLDEVVSRVQDQWMQLCTTLSVTDVERGCNLARLHVARKYNSVVWCAHDLSKQVLFTKKWKSLDMVTASITGVDVDELRALADRYLYNQCPAVAVVGPSETMPDYLRIRSGMWWLRT